MKKQLFSRFRSLVTVSFCFALVLGLASWGTRPVSVSADRPAPAFVVQNLAGGKLSLAQMKGSVVLVNFWATWCGPCVSELPELNAISKEFGPRGLKMVGISVDDSDKIVRNFLKGTKIAYPVAMATESTLASFSKRSAIPQTYLIDRKGVIRKEYLGAINKLAVRADVAALLAEK